MKELLFAIMSVSVCAAVISMLSPDNESVKKQISFVCALSICAALSLPIIRLISSERESFDLSLPKEDISEDTEAVNAIIDLATKEICSEMEAVVERKYGINNAVLTLALDVSDKENVRILSGVLSGEGKLEEAAKYIEEVLGCEIGYEE